MANTLLGLFAVVTLIAINGIAVAGEFALVAVDPTHVDARAAEGSRVARVTQGLLRRLSFHLAGAQLAITITSLLLGLLAEGTIGELLRKLPGLADLDGSIVAVVAIIVATLLQMLLGELMPKNVAISRPLTVSFALARILHVYGVVARPIIGGFNSLADRIVRRLGVEPIEEMRNVRTLDDIAYVVQASHEEGTMEAEDVELLHRAIRLGGRQASDALVPRTAMSSIPADATVADLVEMSMATGHSRFPVSHADTDDIVGIADVRDVLSIAVGSRAARPVSSLVRTAIAVPETRQLDEVLVDLLGARSRMALVVDEHGDTAGVITQEDILEELVGDIADEFDEVAFTVARRGEALVLEGGLHIHEVEELAAIAIPDGPYETLAGFVLQQFGKIPDVDESVEWEQWRFTVAERDGLRVAQIHATPIRADDVDDRTPGETR